MNQFLLADWWVGGVIQEAAKEVAIKIFGHGSREGGGMEVWGGVRRRTAGTLFMFIKQLHHSPTLLRRAVIHFLSTPTPY